jgi:fructokinase
MRIALAGEALIDFASQGGLTFQGHPGGSPLNAAVACARLGEPPFYLTQLSTDLFGDHLVRYLAENGVDTHFVLRADAPSTFAFVEHTAGSNRYAFFTRGSADGGYAPSPLPDLPPETRFLHFGSISLLAEPSATSITAIVAAHVGRTVVVFDPNVRPSLIPDLLAYRARCQGWFARTDLLKLSEEDLELLCPGASLPEAAGRWLAAGAKAVVITRGASGAELHRAGRPVVRVPAPEVKVVDTVGAGDTFSAGLSVGLLDGGVLRAEDLLTASDGTFRRALEFAAAAAALSCTRRGADPPRRPEVLSFLGERRGGF